MYQVEVEPLVTYLQGNASQLERRVYNQILGIKGLNILTYLWA